MNDSIVAETTLNYVGGVDTVPVKVTICNGRTDAPGTWQKHGFELLQHRSAITDWDDDETIAQIHYREIMDFARTLTGCDHAVVSSHIRRNPEQFQVHSDLGPITFVHSDFAENYGSLIKDVYLNEKEAQEGLASLGVSQDVVAGAKRWLILQFWRNVGPLKMDLPIAFCDPQSIDPADLRAQPVKDYAGGNFDFDTLGVAAPASPELHRWYSFPEMNTSEVIAFRTWDSEQIDKNQPFWTPHSAFRDPDVQLGKPARRSVELRATCLFV
jgi:hypothetical protein